MAKVPEGMNRRELADTLDSLYRDYYRDRMKTHQEWASNKATFFDFLAWLHENRNSL